jgi:hypothetical protein
MPFVQTRRRLLTDLAFVGAAGLGGIGVSSLSGSGKSHAAEPLPEISTIRLARRSMSPLNCCASRDLPTSNT